MTASIEAEATPKESDVAGHQCSDTGVTNENKEYTRRAEESMLEGIMRMETIYPSPT